LAADTFNEAERDVQLAVWARKCQHGKLLPQKRRCTVRRTRQEERTYYERSCFCKNRRQSWLDYKAH